MKQEPIARSQIEDSPSTPKAEKKAPKPRSGNAKSRHAKAKAGSMTFNLSLSADQVRAIFQRFDVAPPIDPSELKGKLLELLDGVAG